MLTVITYIQMQEQVTASLMSQMELIC